MFGLGNWGLKSEFDLHLRTLSGNRAIDLDQSECTRCGYCCAMRPCIPTPMELRSIAKYLKLSFEDCVKQYFTLDYIPDYGNPFLLPIRDGQQNYAAGKAMESSWTYDKGYCVFYNTTGKACDIWSVRPQSAKAVECWTEDDYDDEEDSSTQIAVDTWSDYKWVELGFTAYDLKDTLGWFE